MNPISNLLPWIALMFLTANPLLGGTQRVSTDSQGRQKPGTNTDACVSADGRFVAFTSLARLLPEDVHPGPDVYVKDRQTGTLRLVSDDRGGDHPSITANGRFVAYRAFSESPKVLVRDLEREPGTDAVPASILTAVQDYDRPMDVASISPDGRFVAYILGPAPNGPAADLRKNRLFLHDTVSRESTLLLADVQDIGRVVVGPGGKHVYFETTDALDAADQNGMRDVYLNDELPNTSRRVGALWVSKPVPGGSTAGVSGFPAISGNGSQLFFLSSAPLVSGADGQTSLYRADFNGAVTLTRIPTIRTPVALSAQASPAGGFLAYLAKEGPLARGFLLDLNSGVERKIAPNANASISAPALTGDAHLAVFSSAANNLVPNDLNGSPDVFITAPAGAPNARPAPTASFTNNPPPGLVTENSSLNFSAAAVESHGSIRETSIEMDGVTKALVANGTIGTTGIVIPRGVHTLKVRASNDAWIEGVSSAITLAGVRAGDLGITGLTSLTRTLQADGTTVFKGKLRLDNLRNAVGTGALRLVLTEASARADIFPLDDGGDPDVPKLTENIIQVIDLPSMGPLSTMEVDISGVVSAGFPVANGFQGVALVVLAAIQENSGGTFVRRDGQELFSAAPRLNDETPGPNGGVPSVGPPDADNTFNPPVLQSLQILGRSTLAAGASSLFTANALFSNLTARPCTPVWSVTGTAARISATGRLTARGVVTNTPVTVKASLGGKTAQSVVMIKPVSPIVSIAAVDKIVSESGDAGQLRIVRFPVTNQPLTINYETDGKAVNGTDYTTLPGSVTIPAGSASAVIDILPQDDATFEGTEPVTVRLLSSDTYRLRLFHEVTVNLLDNEPLAAGQTDLSIRLRHKLPIGEGIYDADESTSQFVSTAAILNRPVSFVVRLTNPDSVPRNIHLLGGVDFLGFTVRYFRAGEDITDEITSVASFPPGLAIDNMVPGTSEDFLVRITPTSNTPLGGEIECLLNATSDTGRNDVVALKVERVR